MAAHSGPTPNQASLAFKAPAGALAIVLLMVPALVGARTIQASPANYRERMQLLDPGDTLQLSPGIYANGLPIHEMQGRKDQAITITGPQDEGEARFIARPGVNTVSLVDTAYIVIRNLTLDGRNLPVDGVKAEGHSRYAHHITLENLHIVGHGNNQQIVGISTKCPAWGWVIRGNIIEGAGTGIYLGNSNGADPFWAGLIEANQVVDSLGYDLQIKHQNPRPTLQDTPADPAVTIIRNNLFGKSRNATAGVMARPNVLLGHWPLEGPGNGDRYLVYGNWFVDNSTEALFQAEGRLALYNNVFINRYGDAVHIQPHNDIPRDMAIFNNTVLARDAGIVIRVKPASEEHYSQRVEGNLIASFRPIQGGEATRNLTMTYQQVDPDRLYPAARLAKTLKERAHLTDEALQATWHSAAPYPDWDLDRPVTAQLGALREKLDAGVETYINAR